MPALDRGGSVQTSRSVGLTHGGRATGRLLWLVLRCRAAEPAGVGCPAPGAVP